jgi:type IX secretion system PorP/SprF family membrane protein
MRFVIFACLWVLACDNVFSQDITNFTQFFFNPYALNSSYAGIEGQSAAFLGYRKQWATINGGPAIGNVSFHSPLNDKLSFGVNLTNDKRGITGISAGMATIGYTVLLDLETSVRFGLSAGYASTNVDLTKALNDPNINLNDPLIVSAAGSHSSLIGNFGFSFHKKSFHGGIALPNILQPVYLSKDAFTVNASQPFQSVIIHASNRFYFDKDQNMFEPYVIYRLNNGVPSQFEVAGVLHLHNVAWVGASYKQQFGISGMAGFKIQNQLALGISYSLQNSDATQIPAPSYEIQLGFLFGQKKKDYNTYSFVNTEKSKAKRKTNAEVLAERKQKQQQLEKKLKEDKAKHDAQILAKEKQKPSVQPQKQVAATQKQVQQQVVQAPTTKPVVTPPKETTQPKEVVTQNQTKPVFTPPRVVKRDTTRGGARLKRSADLLLDTETTPTVNQPTQDATHVEEQEKLSRIETHADNPLEEHSGEVVHPHAERHEFVKKGEHHEEMDYGDYVIVAVFRSREHAESFTQGLKKMSFKADFGFLTNKAQWYVYIAETDNIEEAKAERDNYRKLKIFRDAWLMTVHQ